MNKKLEGEDFGVLLPFISDTNVTDIDYNGRCLWVTDLKKGRIKTDIEVTKEFIDKFTHRIANLVNKPFNRVNSVLEAQTENLRISIVHESVAVTGRSICIRKSMPVVRNTIDSMIDSNFCQPEILSLLINCVHARMNIAFCGEPGVGKTECSKFFTQFIPANQRVITIEDNLEMHFHEINPENDCVELQIGDELSYTDAIKLCLRQNPKWIMLSEARSTEVKYLLEQWSTGINGFTTLHLDDLRNLPDRIMNMIERSKDAERLENNIYEFIHVGVLIRQREGDQGLERYMDQVCFYDRNDYGNSIYLVLNEAKMLSQELPRNIQTRLNRAGIEYPFWCPETASNFPVELDMDIIREKEKREREEEETWRKKRKKREFLRS